MTHTNTALTEKLSELVDGLFWMSESDYPWQAVAWETPGQLTHEQLLQLTHHDPNTPVEEIGLDKFFAPAITEQDWYGGEEKVTVERYRALVDFLKSNLSDIKVYRVGQSPEIHIYVAGITRDRNLAGISTTSIET